MEYFIFMIQIESIIFLNTYFPTVVQKLKSVLIAGFEVSKYVADEFPAFLKAALTELPSLTKRPLELDELALKKIETSLKDVFIKFDDKLRSKEVMSRLREICNKPEADPENGDFC